MIVWCQECETERLRDGVSAVAQINRQIIDQMDRDFWDMVAHGPYGDRPNIIRSEN